MKLRDYQIAAVNKLHNGSILNGGVGSGKSITSLAYYVKCNGGTVDPLGYMNNPKDLYIITTAHKRDTQEWESELINIHMSPYSNMYKNQVVIDSWNNIKKYEKVYGAFFIFDEQRLTGKGAWVKAFLKIARKNDWILLSATPGDKWEDYIPVFVANGFYKHRSEFADRHIVYKPFSRFPQILRYTDEGHLTKLRRKILVDMDFDRPTVRHHEYVEAEYDILGYKSIVKNRWNPWTNKPIKNASEYCYSLRKIVNSDESRIMRILEIVEDHPKVIIFYNFDYELEILKSVSYGPHTKVAEWNGHTHDPIPSGGYWVYLVQYTAGAEGWNCTQTDCMIFYSLNYSYKVMEQSAGRIDRMNTPFKDLYYYHVRSHSSIDISILRALKSKQKFNESAFSEKSR